MSEKGNKRILLVEDDPDIRGALMDLLDDCGYEVVEAVNGREALDLLENDQNFGLILLDLMMPVMDGLEFRNYQKADPRIAKISTIIMSADGQISTKMQNAQVNAADYVKKPLSIKPLLELIASKIG